MCIQTIRVKMGRKCTVKYLNSWVKICWEGWMKKILKLFDTFDSNLHQWFPASHYSLFFGMAAPISIQSMICWEEKKSSKWIYQFFWQFMNFVYIFFPIFSSFTIFIFVIYFMHHLIIIVNITKIAFTCNWEYNAIKCFNWLSIVLKFITII